jgi:hypothetical protein
VLDAAAPEPCAQGSAGHPRPPYHVWISAALVFAQRSVEPCVSDQGSQELQTLHRSSASHPVLIRTRWKDDRRREVKHERADHDTSVRFERRHLASLTAPLVQPLREHGRGSRPIHIEKTEAENAFNRGRCSHP